MVGGHFCQIHLSIEAPLVLRGSKLETANVPRADFLPDETRPPTAAGTEELH